tara:strand:- start:755 stop:988 length:234 start_codon:yes stop_codon:yes gene_type:complete
MTLKERKIRERIEKTGMTSTTEAFVKYKAFPSFTKNVVLKMIEEGYNISITNDAIDLRFTWLDCHENMVFAPKRALN